MKQGLTGELVRLRRGREEDVDRLVEAEADWEGVRMGSGGVPLAWTRDEARERLLAPFEWDRLLLVVEPLDPELPVAGTVSLFRFTWPERVAMLGMSLHADSRGQGYGTDALQVLCRFGFEQLNLHKIALGTFAFNERAQALYRKVGFVVEGRARDWLFRDGAYHDDVAMGLLAADWRARARSVSVRS